ncbi:site-specific DNA-methyltransferase [Pseudovibrio sp. Tun.PSC04-5.I4]|uniref:DNA-methyltransferase n=1 Tax=Pseudovibrio sp. Tun.PSC04-5.I4 TaxID=1798213 RepID=UPI00088A2DDE|nr:site-specific DNA-methyltransferase [Pseudovibrio sp. Tun.PSC04-5.I4]SDQ99253.1 DNA methylase [Pseudovibrio sp. Tun.PSC04-5.I4]
MSMRAFEILVGDALDVLCGLPKDHFDCVVTSPPYWGLRDYGVNGQIGLEPTLAEHLDKMVQVFEEVRRVLKPEGTCWINYGDCYATTPAGHKADNSGRVRTGKDDRTFTQKPFSTIGPVFDPDREPKDRRGGDCKQSRNEGSNHSGRIVSGGYLKPKDLCMVPNRLAIALQDAGWWVRSEIIWAKPNPMPESIRDRPANAHEKIWLITKSARYFYNAQEVRQGRVSNEDAREFRGGSYVSGDTGKRKSVGNKAVITGQRGHKRPHAGFAKGWDQMTKEEQQANGRNLRNYEPAQPEVWNMATRPFSGAHFATFPPELVERCLSAGCPKGGKVLDPFGGAGTTALVALRMGCEPTLIELNPEYAEIAQERIQQDWMGPDERKRAVVTPDLNMGPLFEGAVV